MTTTRPVPTGSGAAEIPASHSRSRATAPSPDDAGFAEPACVLCPKPTDGRLPLKPYRTGEMEAEFRWPVGTFLPHRSQGDLMFLHFREFVSTN